MSQSRNRFRDYNTYEELSTKFHEMVKDNDILTLAELLTIVDKIAQFYPIATQQNFYIMYVNEVLTTLNTKASFSKFFGLYTGEHAPQLPQIVTKLLDLEKLLKKIKNDQFKSNVYEKYFQARFTEFDLSTVLDVVPTSTSTINSMPNNIQNVHQAIVVVSQRPIIPALVAQVFTEEKQAVIDSLSQLRLCKEIS